jgi:hypothetical protein
MAFMAANLRELREDYAAGRLSLDEYSRVVGQALRDEAAAPATADPFGGHLVKGEQILWVGRPDASKIFAASDRVEIPLSLMWAGFAVFWEATVIRNGGSVFFVLFGAAFVAIGLYLIFGRFVERRLVKRRTWYAVSDRRILVLQRRRSGDDLQAAFVDALLSVGREGDDVVFGNTTLRFDDIPDAEYVADLVAQLRQRRPEH